MAFTTMHFAVGMAGAGTLAAVGALALRRGWRWMPLALTAGGIWACVPDMPRIFKEDFPNLPFAQTLSSKPLQQWLNAHGDWFFLHRTLDEQPKEFALHGLLVILTLYTVSSLLLAVTHRRPGRNDPADTESPEHDAQAAQDALDRAA
ncbi:MAG: hypothetical protein ACE37H_06765 [Phycisphaeraceae bacterium]